MEGLEGRALNNIPLYTKMTDVRILQQHQVPTIEMKLHAPADGHVWLPRSKDHHGGNDLLMGIERPDFYSRKEEIANEYRVHSFRGTSLRAGKKKPVEGRPAHAWIRSLQSGWKISYDGSSIRNRHRLLAHEAVKALGLDFGAVDIGERADGSLFVLEVNRAPGLDGGTIGAYAAAIQKWIEE